MPRISPIAVAAAAAVGMYVDAKYSLGHDLNLITGVFKTQRIVAKRETADNLNVFYVLEEHALNPAQADKDFLVYEGRQWTYRQFYEVVLRYGQWLKETYRIAPNEIIALDCMNRPNFLFIWFGLWAIGAKVAFINYNLTGLPLIHSLKTANSRLVLVDEEVKDTFTTSVLDTITSPDFRGDGLGGIQVEYFSDALEQKATSYPATREPDTVRSGQLMTSLAMLIYTSGTTGNPKPSLIVWGRIYGTMTFVSRWLKIRKEDRYYTCMPLYHSAASTLCMLITLNTGATAILGHKFSTATFWPTVRETRATIIQYVGETCRYLLASPPTPLDAHNDVRIAFGNGLRPDIWDKFKDRFGIPTINEFYASTEGFGSAWNRSSNSMSKGAVGRAGKLANFFARGGVVIVEHDIDTEAPLRDAQGFCKRIDTSNPNAPAGELIYKLPEDKLEREVAFQGYYRNEEATSAKILRDVFVKGDAFYRTGDMMRIDPQGRVYFHDRIGDTFRWKSENVSTNEVADVIAAHPAVAEANVYGISLPHHDGRAGCVAVVLANSDGSERAGTEKVEVATLGSIAEHAVQNLPRYAVPIFLRIPVTMERTGTNKQQKHHLRKQGADHAAISATGDQIFWLQNGRYEIYGPSEWESLRSGKVRF